MGSLAKINEELISYRSLIYCFFFLISLVHIGIAIPLILRKIPPNQFYGWRTPKAFKSKEIWYQINWYFGRDFFATGLVMFILNLVSLLCQKNSSNSMPWLLLGSNLVIFVGGAILSMIRGCRYLKNL